MSKYDHVELMSFVPTDELLSRTHHYVTLTLPRTWKQMLLELRNDGEGSDRNTIPIYSLNSLVRSVLPGIIATYNYARYLNNSQWLLAEAPISTEKILEVVVAWIRAEYSEADGKESVIALHSFGRSGIEMKRCAFIRILDIE